MKYDKASGGQRYMGLLTVAILLCLVILFGAACSILQRKANPFLDREISGPVTISSEWMEITPQEPLKPEHEVNAVTLMFASEYIPDYKENGLRFSDGTVMVPEVQLIDQDGKVYALGIESMGPKGMGFAFFDPISHLESLPKDKVYRTVRIRSDKPIECSKLVWRGYN
jgi:hypothetical protein